jgi:hypothetical protein
LDVEGGRLVSGGQGVIVTNIVNGNMNIDAGVIQATLNKSLSQSNSLFSVLGAINATGGALQVTNFGPGLAVGDKFTLFSAPVNNGAVITVSGAGATWTNNLAVDGSITALTVTPTVNTNPTNITAVVSGGNLNLSWPADHTGWRLQVQTNSRSSGLNPNPAAWSAVPGSSSVNAVSIPISSANGTVFYRMVYP